MPTLILIASLAIFAVLAVVLATNKSNKHTSSKKYNTPAQTETVEEEEEDTLTAGDLNFWDMYQDGTGSDDASSNGLSRKEELEMKEQGMTDADSEANAADEQDEDDPSKDGKHTLVKHMDGTSEWLPINSSIKLNTYEDTSFQKQNGVINYYVGNKKATKTGADISQYTTNVDWSTLSQEVDYVMIRVGARGYDTGKIISDTAFINNVVSATRAGIPFGIYFSSQATTEEEIKEETSYVLSQIAAAQNAIYALNAANTNNSNNGNGNNNNNNNNNNGNNNTNTNTNNNPGYVNGTKLPVVNVAISTTVSDGDGNTTTLYVDGTAVTRYTNGDVVTAYSNGIAITVYSDGKVVRMDSSGNSTILDINTWNSSMADNPLGNYSNNGNNNNTNNGNNSNTNNGSNSNTNGNNNNTGGNTTNNKYSAGDGTNNVYNFEISYPIAMDIHFVPNANARIETLNAADRTTLAKSFCDALKTAGYSTMIYGDKEMLLTKLNLSALSGYDVWINNEGDLPDYPYLMAMWRYDSDTNTIKSLSGDYGLSTSFIDYAER